MTDRTVDTLDALKDNPRCTCEHRKSVHDFNGIACSLCACGSFEADEEISPVLEQFRESQRATQATLEDAPIEHRLRCRRIITTNHENEVNQAEREEAADEIVRLRAQVDDLEYQLDTTTHGAEAPHRDNCGVCKIVKA